VGLSDGGLSLSLDRNQVARQCICHGRCPGGGVVYRTYGGPSRRGSYEGGRGPGGLEAFMHVSGAAQR